MSQKIYPFKDNIEIRFATTEDREQIYDFALAAIKGADLPEFAEDAGQNLQDRVETGDPENVLIAVDKDQNKIIGYIELDPDKSPNPKAMHIRGIYVLPEYRRRGIGNEMLRIIRENKVSKDTQLRVTAFTLQGLRFWENYGFKIHHYALYHDPNQ